MLWHYDNFLEWWNLTQAHWSAAAMRFVDFSATKPQEAGWIGRVWSDQDPASVQFSPTFKQANQAQAWCEAEIKRNTVAA